MNVPRKHHPLLPSTVNISTPLTTVVVMTAASARTRSSRCRDESNDRAQQEFAETPDRVQRILDDSTSEAKENIDHETDPCFDIGRASCLRCVDRRVGGERRLAAALDLGRHGWWSEYIVVGEIEGKLDLPGIANASKILDSQSMIVIHHGQRKTASNGNLGND